jgi:hypothetical protein
MLPSHYGRELGQARARVPSEQGWVSGRSAHGSWRVRVSGMSSKRFLCCSFSCCFDVFIVCNNPGTSNAVLCACFFVSHPPTLRPSPACSTWDSGLLLVGAHPHSQSGGGPTPTISWEQTCRKTGSIVQEGERGQSPRPPGIVRRSPVCIEETGLQCVVHASQPLWAGARAGAR